VGLAKSRDQRQPLSSENEYECEGGDDDDDNDDNSDDKGKFPTNCTISSSDTPTCFDHKSQPFSRQLQY
jgi:hypothetical protein